ncbi:MAG: hypothetical protein EBZ51_01785 [Synechococcaceae bacterium WB9_2_112]|jgi:hypothetical protein|nr:hypothetical protein [Synechococcaceae bacterium WB9_2_112]
MLGPVIAMATVVVPLATVLGGRQPLGFPDPLPASAADPAPSARITSAWSATTAVDERRRRPN